MSQDQDAVKSLHHSPPCRGHLGHKLESSRVRDTYFCTASVPEQQNLLFLTNNDKFNIIDVQDDV